MKYEGFGCACNGILYKCVGEANPSIVQRNSAGSNKVVVQAGWYLAHSKIAQQTQCCIVDIFQIASAQRSVLAANLASWCWVHSGWRCALCQSFFTSRSP